jgi:hypothetical protein
MLGCVWKKGKNRCGGSELPVGRTRKAGLELLVLWPKAKNFKNRLAITLAQNGALVVAEAHAPYSIARESELANNVTSLDIPEFDAAVIAARNDKAIVKLETGDAVVVSAEAVNARVVGEVEHNDSTIGSAGDEPVARELELTNKGRVTLQD